MATIAGFIGALAIQGLITAGLIKLFAKWNSSVPGILTANGLALCIATVIGGFGFSRGPEPVFGEAFSMYVLPQLVVLGLTLWGWTKKQA